jgi:hypothetical protein
MSLNLLLLPIIKMTSLIVLRNYESTIGEQDDTSAGGPGDKQDPPSIKVYVVDSLGASFFLHMRYEQNRNVDSKIITRTMVNI